MAIYAKLMPQSKQTDIEQNNSVRQLVMADGWTMQILPVSIKEKQSACEMNGICKWATKFRENS
jgi:hypothetical protein